MSTSLAENSVKSKPFIIGKISAVRRFVCQQSPANPRALFTNFERMLCKIFRDEQEIIIVSIKSLHQPASEACLRDDSAREFKDGSK